MSLAVSAQTIADVIRYEVVDLESLGDVPSLGTAGLTESTAYAINNNWVIVGASAAAGGIAETHAAVWVYCPRYGLPMGTPAGTWWALPPYDLTADMLNCPGNATCANGAAYDINTNDLIVGEQSIDAPSNTVYWPTVYRLPTVDDAGGLVGTQFLPLAVPAGEHSATARAINDWDPALVVGDTEITGGSPLCGVSRWGFIWVDGANPPPAQFLPPVPGHFVSAARDIDSTPVPAAVGDSDKCGTTGDCGFVTEAVRWPAATLTPASLSKLPVASQGGTVKSTKANGCNDAGMAVGIVRNDAFGCLPQPAYWEPSQSDRVLNLGDIGPIGSRTIVFGEANKVAEPTGSGTVRIVGREQDDKALLWECVDCNEASERFDPSRWTVTNLNDVTSRNCGLSLKEANDINDAGWIVGRGELGGRTRGFLLRPIECLADLDRDCDVDAADLAILLGRWGNVCALPCEACNTDLNADFDINAGDLAILLGRWGAECSCSDPCEGGLMASGSAPTSEASLGTPELPNLDAALESLGFASVPELQAWMASASEAEIEGIMEILHAVLAGS